MPNLNVYIDPGVYDGPCPCPKCARMTWSLQIKDGSCGVCRGELTPTEGDTLDGALRAHFGLEANPTTSP